jgi:hypothetical protein
MRNNSWRAKSYSRLVLNTVLKIVRAPGEAEDVMQTVFLEILLRVRLAVELPSRSGVACDWSRHACLSIRRTMVNHFFSDVPALAEAGIKFCFFYYFY